jgi:hypothetical protein
VVIFLAVAAVIFYVIDRERDRCASLEPVCPPCECEVTVRSEKEGRITYEIQPGEIRLIDCWVDAG